MSEPQNPNTIIIKNQYYQKGLKEIDIWKYYKSNQGLILRETMGRDVMFAIATNTNEFILKRKDSGKTFIRLNQSNFDNLIHGRTTVIYSIMNRVEEFGIVDIDTDNWNDARETAQLIFRSLRDMNVIESLQIRYTGKLSFHIKCNFRSRYDISIIKQMLYDHLSQDQNITRNCTIEKKRNGREPNIDLFPNVFRAAHITLGSLSTMGLRCIEVPYDKVMYYTRDSARIFAS